MKWHGLKLEHRWQKTKSESNWKLARTHAWAYAVAIASVQSCPAGLLLQSGPLGVEGEQSVDCCDLFTNYFSVKIN